MSISQEEIDRLVQRQKKEKEKWDTVKSLYQEAGKIDEFLEMAFDEVMDKYDELAND